MRVATAPVRPDLRSTLRRLVDPEYGIADKLVELGATAEAADVFVTCAAGGPASYMIDHAATPWMNCSAASGAAYRREDAFWATLGELSERYCAAVYDREQMIWGRAESFGPAAMPVESMILFSGAQYSQPDFPFMPYDKAQNYYWHKGVHFRSGREIFAPAPLLYLSYEWKNRMLMQTVSTGLACHSEPEKAYLSAMFELIERDGFASAWALGMGLPQLHLSSADRLCLSLETQRALENDVLQIRLYGLPNEFGVANIIAVTYHTELGYGALGAAAAASPYQAIEKAVLEAQHTWIALARSNSGATGDAVPDPNAIRTPHDHSEYYMHPQTWSQLDRFLDGDQCISISDLTAGTEITSSAELARKLSGAGYETYMFDLTTEDIASLGFHVVRALVPGLQPLCLGADLFTDDRRRLRRLADFWDCPMPKTLNRNPHPFP